MLAALPLLGLAGLVAVARARTGDLRTAALHAATIWGALVVAVSEGLSAVGRVSPAEIGAAWAAVALALGVVAWSLLAAPAPPAARAGLALADRMLLLGAGVLVALVGVVAVLSPPNTWDAMQYHVPRVVHWLQNRTLAFYPTHELKQLHMPPGAEYAVLQLHALSGGDRLDNLVQWLALVGSVIGASLVARELGAGTRGQVLAAVVCATIHEGLLGASGSKNDSVAAFWLLATAAYALRFGRSAGWTNAAGLGAALGLAWLTKGTSYVVAGPLLAALWLSWPMPVKRALLRHLPLIALVAIGLNAGHFARNQAFYGSPLGPRSEAPDGSFKYTNDVLTPASVASNLVRNAAVHWRSESRAANAALEERIRRALAAIGADADDPRTSFFNGAPFRLDEVAIHEGFAGDPAHVALIVATLGIAVFTGRRPERRALAIFALGAALSFVAFCAVFKWQPHLARLHVPLLVLWSPAIGAAMGAAWPPWLARAAAAALLVLAAPMAVDNDARPLSSEPGSVHRAGRDEQYFGDRRGLARDYLAAIAFVRDTGCRRIGLDLSTDVGDQYEYPWLALLGAGTTAEVRPVAVPNPSAVYASRLGGFDPCVVVCVRCPRDAWRRYGGDAAVTARFGEVAILRPTWAPRARWTAADLRVPGAWPDPPESDRRRPAVQLLVERTRLRPGDRMRIGVEAKNPRPDAADLYLGVVLPDGASAVFVDPAGRMSGPVGLADASRYPRARTLAGGSSLAESSLSALEIPAAGPAGTYRVFAFLVASGTARAAAIPPEDFLASAVRDVAVGP